MENKVIKILCIVCLVLISLFYTSCTTKIKSPSSTEITAKNKITQTLNSAEQAKSDNPNKEITFEDFDKSNLPLISAIPERNVYLYGIKPNGVVLYVDGKGHYYNWDYLTPRFILPEMNIGDYDNDGKEELSIVLYVGSGTGYAVEELHIIEISEKEFLSEEPSDKDFLVPNPKYFKDNFYKPDDYLNQLSKLVKLKTYYRKGELMANIRVDKKSYIVSLKERQSMDKNIVINNDVALGDIVHFKAKDNKLSVQLGLGVTDKTFATPDYIGDIHADVKYKAGKFTISSLRFEPNKD